MPFPRFGKLLKSWLIYTEATLVTFSWAAGVHGRVLPSTRQIHVGVNSCSVNENFKMVNSIKLDP